MIKRIFFDLDETLLHTIVGNHPNQECYTHKDNSRESYFTIFRPDARDLISFARELVGKENVYILTAATRSYAHELNSAGCFDFDHDHIFAREDQDRYAHKVQLAYGSDYIYAENKDIADPENVLIDNLPERYNEGKCSFIGMRDISRYIKVNDYYGANGSWVAAETERVKNDIRKLYDLPSL